jgi:hypothetical protein
MISKTGMALAALLVVGPAATAAAASDRITHRARVVRPAPPSAFQPPNATTSHAVKPFTAEEKGWFDRASRVF